MKRLTVWVMSLMVFLLGAPVWAQTSSPTDLPEGWYTVEQAIAAPEKTMVRIRARIVSVLPPRPDSNQPYSVYVVDGTGKVRVVIFQATWKEMADTSFLMQGSTIDVYGEAGTFKEVPQIAIQKPHHVRLTPGTNVGGRAGFDANQFADTFTPVTIGVLNITTVGQKVRVKGTVAEYEESTRERFPTRVVVRDQTGSIEAIYWEDLAAQLTDENRPVLNQEIEIDGIVNEYRGKLQLRVDEPTWIRRPKPKQPGDNAGG